MRKIISFQMILVLLALCGCGGTPENTDTRFLLDTFVTLSGDCSPETLAEAFEVCTEYEKLLSRTAEGSDVSLINSTNGNVKISEHTAKIIQRAIYYGDISGGAFDITLYPVNILWDFNKKIVPERSEIAEALQNVDYQSISLNGDQVNTNGKRIDLGGIAKGYIADRIAEFLKENGTENGMINSGSTIVIFGKERTVKIRKPFTEDEYSAELTVKNRSVSTSGIYERYIEQDGKIYHHILDPETGYGAETDLSCATVICENALDGDALSTVCILLGRDKAAELIESTPDTEAVFIDRSGELSFTSGISRKDGKLLLKN